MSEYKLSSKSKDVIHEIFEVASRAAAKRLLHELVHGDEDDHECDCDDSARLLADDFLSSTLYLDDGRFGLADPISKAAGPTDGRRYSDPLPPKDTAVTLVRLMHHLMQRSKIQNRPKFLQNIREHLTEINPYMLSKKRNNPSAAIGAAMNITKNVLQSQPPTVISAILGQLYRML